MSKQCFSFILTIMGLYLDVGLSAPPPPPPYSPAADESTLPVHDDDLQIFLPPQYPRSNKQPSSYDEWLALLGNDEPSRLITSDNEYSTRGNFNGVPGVFVALPYPNKANTINLEKQNKLRSLRELNRLVRNPDKFDAVFKKPEFELLLKDTENSASPLRHLEELNSLSSEELNSPLLRSPADEDWDFVLEDPKKSDRQLRSPDQLNNLIDNSKSEPLIDYPDYLLSQKSDGILDNLRTYSYPYKLVPSWLQRLHLNLALRAINRYQVRCPRGYSKDAIGNCKPTIGFIRPV